MLSASHARNNPLRYHPVVRVVILLIVGVLVSAGTVVGLVYNRLQGNIEQHDVSVLLDRPEEHVPIDEKQGQPLNILLLGSDVRQGASDIDGGREAGITGMRSDTTMLVHVSADRSHIEVVSIPRDLLVEIPPCTLPNGRKTRTQHDAMFNSAFAIGGQTDDVNAAAACSIRTIEKMSKLTVDGYVVVDFASFKKVVNALGGVEMHFDKPLRDKYAGLDVPAGNVKLNGDQALALARARKQVGDGSDISRIGRQHELVRAIIRDIFKMNPFTNLPTFYTLLSDVTSNLVTSEGLGNLRWLAGFLYSLKSIDQNNIHFITLPWLPAGNRVRPAPRDQVLWEALKTDKSITADEAWGKKSTGPGEVGTTYGDGETAPGTVTPPAPHNPAPRPPAQQNPTPRHEQPAPRHEQPAPAPAPEPKQPEPAPAPEPKKPEPGSGSADKPSEPAPGTGGDHGGGNGGSEGGARGNGGHAHRGGHSSHAARTPLL